MIEAKELRIGNYFEVSEGVYKVEQINYEEEDGLIGVSFNKGNDWTIMIFTDPVPINEEWLLKLGFEEYNNSYHIFLPNGNDKGAMYLGVDSEYNCFSLCDMRDRNDTAFLLDAKHVHQLQNLYFALTGEELTIKTN